MDMNFCKFYFNRLWIANVEEKYLSQWTDLKDLSLLIYFENKLDTEVVIVLYQTTTNYLQTVYGYGL